jgi:hypothetical protein
MTQELGTVVALDGKLDFSKYPIGSTLKILPNHVRSMFIAVVFFLSCDAPWGLTGLLARLV